MDNINNEIPLSEISKFLKDYYNKFGNFDNLIKHINNEVLNPIKTTNNSHKEKNSRFVNMSSFENIETIDYAVLSLVSKEELLYLQNIPEIVEQISNEVNPEEIAQNMEDKTGVSFDIWISRIANIIAIIIGILTLIGVISDTQNIVNETNIDNSINVEQMINVNLDDIDKEELAKYIIQNMNQINDQKNDLPNDK